ncbi:hypothetical protein [Leucobacter salsicius]|uniref:hypothetical protein n=1 Tax=Leucobacter salsicius TaxID=664638 RepID=UPI00034762B3|nr:hypothetical protein [Leucobacter salsicius]
MPRIRATDLIDVFVYTVVLGTFTQLFPQVISESFLTSLITAVLLKVVLEVVVRLKTTIVTRFKNADSMRVKVVAAVSLSLVGGGSKALILWLTDVILGDAVYLGGFFAVTLLVVTLMLARAGVRRLVR